MSYKFILAEKDGPGVVTLNRPQQLDALFYGLIKELSLAMEAFFQDEEIRRQQNRVRVD